MLVAWKRRIVAAVPNTSPALAAGLSGRSPGIEEGARGRFIK